MKKIIAVNIIGAAVVLAALGVLTAVSAGENEYKLARAVANYLISARAVIADNQELINDPSKGDKRFTPERYAELVRKDYLERSSIDLQKLKSSTTDIFSSSIFALHQSAMDVTASFQPRIASTDPGFKGVHPAVFGARIGQELYKRSDIRLKQTSKRYRATAADQHPDQRSLLPALLVPVRDRIGRRALGPALGADLCRWRPLPECSAIVR